MTPPDAPTDVAHALVACGTCDNAYVMHPADANGTVRVNCPSCGGEPAFVITPIELAAPTADAPAPAAESATEPEPVQENEPHAVLPETPVDLTSASEPAPAAGEPVAFSVTCGALAEDDGSPASADAAEGGTSPPDAPPSATAQD